MSTSKIPEELLESFKNLDRNTAENALQSYKFYYNLYYAQLSNLKCNERLWKCKNYNEELEDLESKVKLFSSCIRCLENGVSYI
ncbi:Hypothetical protein ORPV_147 [Orpheovirus IHUMI-LCC2]|uniref:Uncharacterized protein n=1 Tax=Orpheovirus IHUMI-LCC2 TaxID=2023057 RepID=A0A2I2L3E8_9VIRU|nr:Hypothetical protein ORPV_147 [Orpheovirus IHUMI-LCC2]SNW62051.1 Hypothetical protein ORPV_147 [Orpheovirus IHUMI-LCC2]